MDADVQRILMYVLQGLGGAFCTVIWFAYRDLKAKQESDRESLAAYKLHVAESYVTQNVMTKAIDSIAEALKTMNQSMDKKLDRIEYKLDGKQDKGGQS